MDTEHILIATIFVIGCLPVVISLTCGKSVGLRALLAVLPAAFAIPLAFIDPPISESEIIGRPIEIRENPYVSSHTCRSCHPREYGTWHRSYHRVMTRVATPENVIGRFDGQEESIYGLTYRLGRDGDQFWIEMPDPDGAADSGSPRQVRKDIVMTTGRHHVQVYWFSSGEGRKLSLVPIVYLVPEGRWVPRQSTFLRPPSGGMVIDVGRWNTGCIHCHTTGGEPGMESGEFDTHATEFGIACESCHGPAHDHVAANHDPIHRYGLRLGDEASGDIVDPADLTEHRASQVCGQCHGAWSGAHENPHASEADLEAEAKRGRKRFLPGEDLDAQRKFIFSREEAEKVRAGGSFWPDGQIRVAGREYNGLLQSPCFSHGDSEKKRMSCLSCHEMHPHNSSPEELEEWRADQLIRGMRTNEACLGCHEEFADKIEEHTHHSAGSSGSLCYNCHMSFTTYGLMKALRSHTIESPSVRTSLETGRPNACNQCHLDKTLSWTADKLREWYGHPVPRLSSEDRSIAASVLWATRGDAAQRALMAWSFGWKAAQQASGTAWMAVYLVELMNDPYDAVRLMAYRSLKTLPAFEGVEYDFLGRVSERRLVGERVMPIWMRKFGAPGARAAQQLQPTVLFSPNGEFRFDVLDRLLKQRDLRPTIIVE